MRGLLLMVLAFMFIGVPVALAFLAANMVGAIYFMGGSGDLFTAQDCLDMIRQTMGSDEPNDDLLEAIRELKQDRAAQRPKTPARVTAKRGAKILVLAPNEIRWFEAEETLVFAQTAGGRVLIERTLADLEETMGPSFFRCHRRYLVNLAFIREIFGRYVPPSVAGELVAGRGSLEPTNTDATILLEDEINLLFHDDVPKGVP